MGHIGLTPQSVLQMGGYRVQGKTLEAARELIEDALALERAGAFAIVLEGIPAEISRLITDRVRIPTIGIGAGINCDGQILVFSDLVGMTFGHTAKFVRRYADVKSVISNALRQFADDVAARRFPAEQESYHLPEGVVIEVLTPFMASTQFPAQEPIERVVVHDDAGKHEVPVVQGSLTR